MRYSGSSNKTASGLILNNARGITNDASKIAYRFLLIVFDFCESSLPNKLG